MYSYSAHFRWISTDRHAHENGHNHAKLPFPIIETFAEAAGVKFQIFDWQLFSNIVLKLAVTYSLKPQNRVYIGSGGFYQLMWLSVTDSRKEYCIRTETIIIEHSSSTRILRAWAVMSESGRYWAILRLGEPLQDRYSAVGLSHTQTRPLNLSQSHWVT